MVNAIKPEFHTPKDVKKIAEKQLNLDDVGPLAAVVVGFLGTSYLDLTDLSKLRCADLINEQNTIKDSFVHPISRKVVVIPNGWFTDLLLQYIEWCKIKNIGQQNLDIYLGRNPNSFFLLRANGEEFVLSPKSKKANNCIMQPQALTRFVKKLNLPLGMTPRSLNKGYLINIADQQFRYGNNLTAIVNLEAVTQLHRTTIIRLTKRSPETIEQSVKSLFS